MSDASPVLFLAAFLDGDTAPRYGYGWAQSGLNKKRSVLRAVRDAGAEIVVVSPLLLTGRGFRLHRPAGHRDPETGVEVRFPRTARTWFPVNLLLLTLSTIRTLRALRRSHPFGTVIFYNWHVQLAVPAFLAKLLWGSRVILEYEDGLFAGARHASVGWMARALRVVLDRFLDGAIVNSSTFLELTSAPRHEVLRGTVDTAAGGPGTADGARWEAGGERPGGSTVVMFAGRIDEIRGIDLFVEACRTLRERDDVEFWITGPGEEETLARVEAEVEALGSGNVRFFGFLPFEEYRERMSRADVLVSLQKPSHPFSRFCFPSKLVEYMASGKLVVSTRVSDVESIARGRLVLVEEDVSEIARALASILDDPGRYRSYPPEARRWALSECSREANAERVGRLLLGGQPRSNPQTSRSRPSSPSSLPTSSR